MSRGGEKYSSHARCRRRGNFVGPQFASGFERHGQVGSQATASRWPGNRPNNSTQTSVKWPPRVKLRISRHLRSGRIGRLFPDLVKGDLVGLPRIDDRDCGHTLGPLDFVLDRFAQRGSSVFCPRSGGDLGGRRRKGVIRVGGRRHLRNGRLDAAKSLPALASPILANQLSCRSLSGYTPCFSVVQYLSLNSVSSRIIA